MILYDIILYYIILYYTILYYINKMAGFDPGDPPLRLARSGNDTSERGPGEEVDDRNGASEQEKAGERMRKQSLHKRIQSSDAAILVEVAQFWGQVLRSLLRSHNFGARCYDPC